MRWSVSQSPEWYRNLTKLNIALCIAQLYKQKIRLLIFLFIWSPAAVFYGIFVAPVLNLIGDHSLVLQQRWQQLSDPGFIGLLDLHDCSKKLFNKIYTDCT